MNLGLIAFCVGGGSLGLVFSLLAIAVSLNRINRTLESIRDLLDVAVNHKP